MVTQPAAGRKNKVRLADRLSKEFMCLDLKSKTKDDVIRELAECLKTNEKLTDFDQFLIDVYKREAEASTGIGNGVAIPHARTNTVSDFIVAIGRSNDGIEFDAVDKKPVKIMILMGTPLEKVSLYLKLLAHLSHLLKRPGFVEGLIKASDAEAVIALFRSHEGSRVIK